MNSESGFAVASKRSLKRTLLGRLGGWAFRLARTWASRKQEANAEHAGARLGKWLFWLNAKHRKRAIANLRLAFPELDDRAVRALATRTFEHFGRVAMDFLRTESRSKEEVLASVEDCGFSYLLEALQEGKGVLLVTAHFGNWERFGQYSSARGVPLQVVARDADEPALQNQVLRLREAAGMEVLSRGNAARAILGALKRNKVVGLLPDQNSSESFIPLFGKPAGTVLGPAVLHLRTGAPIVAMFCPRVGVGRYRAILYPPMRFPRETPPETIMAAFHEKLEEVVRRYPEQWLWLHDRWKSARKKGLL